MRHLILHLALALGVCFGQAGRNMHGKCTVVINEVFVGQTGFIELAKLCNDNEVHDYKKLGGYVLLIVNATDTSILKLIWLHDKSLKVRQSQSVTLPETSPIDGQAVVPPTQSVSLIAPDSQQVQTDGVYGLSVQRFEEINCGRNPNCKTTIRPNRQRRSPELIQTKARFFYVVELDKILVDEFLIAVFLLKLEDKEAKSFPKVRDMFPAGSQLSESLLVKAKSTAVDTIVLANTTCDFQQQLNELLPEGLIGKTPVMVSDTDTSYSKCDDSLLPMMQESFKVSTSSLWNPNICSVDSGVVDVDSEVEDEDLFNSLPFKFKGMKLLRQAKQLVINLWYLIGVNEDTELLSKNVVEITAKLLNLGKTTVYDIIRQFNNGEEFSNNNKRNRAFPITDIEDEEKVILYKIITGYYKRNEIPKLRLMQEEFMKQVSEHRKKTDLETQTSTTSQSDSDFTCCSRSFAVILNKNGYSYGRINSKDTAVHAPYVIHNRRKYLKRKAEVDANDQINVVFQDETWIDPHSRPTYGWKKMPKFCTMESRYDFMFQKYKSSRGGRILVLGIGGEDGYINCATTVYKVSKSKSALDYHSNVDGKFFIKWMEKVISCLPTGKKFVIVMDSCPFHNLKEAPDSKGKKEVLYTWLKQKKREKMPGIPSNLEALKRDQLWQVVKEVRNQIPAIIDNMVSKAGHEILRLPQYSPEMNPIEYAWKDLKHHVRDKNTKQDINDAVNLAQTFMNSYGGDKWKKHIGHCQKVEQMYRDGDAEYDAFIQNNPDMYRLQPWEDAENEEDDYEFNDPDESIDEMPLIQDSSFEASTV